MQYIPIVQEKQAELDEFLDKLCYYVDESGKVEKVKLLIQKLRECDDNIGQIINWVNATENIILKQVLIDPWVAFREFFAENKLLRKKHSLMKDVENDIYISFYQKYMQQSQNKFLTINFGQDASLEFFVTDLQEQFIKKYRLFCLNLGHFFQVIRNVKFYEVQIMKVARDTYLKCAQNPTLPYNVKQTLNKDSKFWINVFDKIYIYKIQSAFQKGKIPSILDIFDEKEFIKTHILDQFLQDQKQQENMLKNTMTILKDLLDENQYQDNNLKEQIKQINEKIVVIQDDNEELNKAINSINLE